MKPCGEHLIDHTSAQLSNVLITDNLFWYTGAHISWHELFLAGNQSNYQNLVPSMLIYKFWLIFMEMKQIFFFFWKKKSKWQIQKNWVFQLRQLRQFSIFFMRISGINPCICRINSCERHQCGSIYVVIRLFDISCSKKG